MTISTWRSETFQALAAIPEQSEFQQSQAQYINDQLFDELSQVFPNLFHQQSKISFLQKVTVPAANLAIAIRGSTTKYAFDLPRDLSMQLRPALEEDVKKFRLVESKTFKHLKPSSIVVANKGGQIGDSIIVFEPALSRVDRDGNQNILVPEMILVELFHPLGKRKRA